MGGLREVDVFFYRFELFFLILFEQRTSVCVSVCRFYVMCSFYVCSHVSMYLCAGAFT